MCSLRVVHAVECLILYPTLLWPSLTLLIAHDVAAVGFLSCYLSGSYVGLDRKEGNVLFNKALNTFMVIM